MNARNRNRLLPLLTLVVLPVLASLLSACSSDSSTAPNTDDDTLGLPAIPRLSDYGDNPHAVPDTSEVLVDIRPWTGTFAPVIADMNTEYNLSTVVRVTNPIGGGTIEVNRILGTYDGWSDQVFPQRVTFDAGLDGEKIVDVNPYNDGNLRMVLARDGQPLAAPERAGSRPSIDSGSYVWNVNQRSYVQGGGIFPVYEGDRIVTYRVPAERMPAANEAPYLKRELFWIRTAIGGEEFQTMPPNDTYQEESSYTVGVSETESYEFFWSLTVEVSGGWGPVSASVAASVGETFGTSVTVSEERTETVSRTYNSPADHGMLLSRWILIQRFSFCNAAGENLLGDRFRFADSDVQFRMESRVQKEPFDGNVPTL